MSIDVHCKRTRPAAKPPRVWLLLGDKLGDNAQVRAIAERLGWPGEIRRVAFRERYVQGKPLFWPSLYHVDKARSDPLVPPWPDLVITIGRRPAMAALWIKGQSRGRTKIVLIGRPKRWLERFDLVIASAQYRLPERPNVLHVSLPLMHPDEAAVAAASRVWRLRLAGLPPPLTALLIGGPTKPFVLDERVARALIEKAVAVAGGGTLYVTTSRRTPAAVVAALQAGLPPGAVLYRWTAGQGDNPYLGLLGLADRFIVTGDSVSMLVEVVRLGKPLAIFPLPRQPNPVTRFGDRLAARLHRQGPEGGAMQALGDVLYRLGLAGYSRDLTAFHRLLVERGLAAWLGKPLPPPGRQAPDELPEVVRRIEELGTCGG